MDGSRRLLTPNLWNVIAGAEWAKAEVAEYVPKLAPEAAGGVSRG